MSLYNPFKWHIVQELKTQKFYIRKITILGWEYADAYRKNTTWQYMNTSTEFDSLSKAEHVFDTLTYTSKFVKQ